MPRGRGRVRAVTEAGFEGPHLEPKPRPRVASGNRLLKNGTQRRISYGRSAFVFEVPSMPVAPWA